MSTVNRRIRDMRDVEVQAVQSLLDRRDVNRAKLQAARDMVEPLLEESNTISVALGAMAAIMHGSYGEGLHVDMDDMFLYEEHTLMDTTEQEPDDGE